MAISKPCPRCQQPLSIPEPIPEKIQCAKCGAVIKYKASAPPPLTPGPSHGGRGEKEAAVPAKAPASPVVEAPFEFVQDAAPAINSPAATDSPKSARTSERAASAGFLSLLHALIPKPVLFGCYGAVGGFLGVLLLGELFWLVLHPTPQEMKPLIVTVPSELTLYPGTVNTITVNIARQGFDGPVRIDAVDLPKELVFFEITIPADKSEGELRIGATEEMALGSYQVKLRAMGSDPGNAKFNVKVDETIQVGIQEIPANLRLTASRSVTVYAGGQNRFGFMVARGRFEGPVRVEALDLPKGVQIPLVTLQEKETQGSMGVTVAKDAELRTHMVLMEVRSLVDHRIMHRKTLFQLEVRPPPGKLQLAASPKVTVYPGTKNRFSVKISRQEFTGPIQIDVDGAPRGVTFTSEVIPADKTETEIEVYADVQMKAGGPPTKGLRVTAKTLAGENITAEIPLELNIEVPPPTVQLAVSSRVPVYPGGKATFGVKISRARFQGPVQVAVEGAKPAFVTIPPIVIPADKSEGEMEVAVSQAALGVPLKMIAPLQVVARSLAKSNPGLPASEKVDVEILPPPSDLQLTVSPEMEIYQAGKNSFTIKVARTGFIGPVQVAFNKVPAGVTLTPAPLFGNDLVFTGRATIDTVPKKYEIEVTGTGPKAPDGKVPAITKQFSLTVKPFDPSIRPPLDIVFVLDVTQSLDPQIAGLRDGIGQFVKGLKDRELVARIGLVGFRDIISDQVPFERLKFKGDLFTDDTKVFAAEVGKLQATGGGDDPESSLDAIVEATKYPFQPKALKVLLLITDEKPQTKGNSATMLVAQKALRDKKIDQVHLIIKKADMLNYADLQQVAKGGFFDFQQASKKTAGNEGFASLLPLLSKEIATTIGAPEPVAKAPPAPDSAAPPPAPAGATTPEPKAEASPNAPRPVAPQPPKAGEASIIQSADPGPPEAEEVSPPSAPATTLPGVQSTQRYAQEDGTWLMIAVALWTAALAAGIALTLVIAQKRYLSQAWLSLGDAAKAVLAGFAAGVLAGVASQWFLLKVTTGSAFWDATSQVISWILLGGLIGGAMGLFVPNMNWKRAFVGGCIGGFIGGLGFMLIRLLADSYLAGFLGAGLVGLLGRLIGATLVGLFIGIMVALAEIASRRYWLEVAFGEREIRTVTLGASTVTLGGDERQVGVYVPNAPPKAIAFRVEKNRVLCEDFSTGKTTEASPGDQRALANARIKVCTAAEARPAGANLQLVVVRDVPLMVGMPLTIDDIPGLEAQSPDGIVALVSRRPSDPKVYLLRNRSKQAWIVTDAEGKQRKVEPGLGIELASRCEIDFGQVKGVLDPTKDSA